MTISRIDRVMVRPLVPSDEDSVRRLFRETVALGKPLPFPVAHFERYERLCLDWYLTDGQEDGAVAVCDGQICGYALVCTKPSSHRRWVRWRGALFPIRIMLPALRRTDGGRFYRLRLRDGWRMWRNGPPDPMPAHVHLNLVASERGRETGRLLVDHIDQRCEQAGLPGWFGEMNAPAGHRARALERLGAVIVHRAPNLTLSWVLGRSVERLTVVRRIDSRGRPSGVSGDRVCA